MSGTVARTCLIGLGLLMATWSLAGAGDERVGRIVRQVRATGEGGSFDGFMRALPVDETAERGYEEDGSPQDDLVDARKVIFEALAASLGRAHVSYQRFDADGCRGVNVIGILEGRGPRRTEQYVLTAHYDAEQNAGADDNGSGVAGLLEVARVLGRCSTDATVVFVATDQEEERDLNGWGRGSEAFVKHALASRAHMRAVVALDMIAFDHAGSHTVTVSRVDTERGTRSERLSDDMVRAFRTYTRLRVETREGEDESDPYRFFQAGVPVVLVSEQMDADGWPLNPDYHTSRDFCRTRSGHLRRCDGRVYMDSAYAADVLRGVVGWTATAAGIMPPGH